MHLVPIFLDDNLLDDYDNVVRKAGDEAYGRDKNTLKGFASSDLYRNGLRYRRTLWENAANSFKELNRNSLVRQLWIYAEGIVNFFQINVRKLLIFLRAV